MSYNVMVINPVEGHTSGPMEALWYSEPYFEQIYEYLRRLEATGQLRVIHVHKEAARRGEIWGNMSADKFHYVVAVGHGNDKVYTAYRLEKVFWIDMRNAGFKPEWAKDTVFLMLSCVTAAKLGPWMHNTMGAWCYVGWDHLFGFFVRVGVRKGGDWRNSPDMLWLKPIEEAFKRCASQEMAPVDVVNYIKRKYAEAIHNPEVPERWKGVLAHDLKHLKLIGNGTHPPVGRGAVAMRIPVEALIAATAGALIGSAIGMGVRYAEEKRIKVL